MTVQTSENCLEANADGTAPAQTKFPSEAGAHPGLWPSPWPAEDAGPARSQQPQRLREGAGGGAGAGGRLTTRHARLGAWRDAYATTMVVLREPGEVFALRNTLPRRLETDPTKAWVERIDPVTLIPLARSRDLAGDPFWPGGIVAHANGSLIVVYGRWCHRLSPDLDLFCSRELPVNRPYNSFVVLPGGALVAKDLDRSERHPSTLSVLDPVDLEPCAPAVRLPEPAIARLSADGDTVYVVGTRTVMRLHWDGTALVRDPGWHVVYRTQANQSYGWDPVIAGGQLWFMDNGAHDYATTMLGAGRASGAVHLFRVSLTDAGDRERVAISGLPHGTVTNPPVYDERRRIALAYDSGHGLVRAFRFGTQLEPLWRRPLAHAAHMLLRPEAGEVVVGDFRGPAYTRTRTYRRLAHRLPSPAGSARVRRALARSSGDDVVVLDLETGEERARVRVPSMFQSVLFPAPGWNDDLYWCTFSSLARVELS